jgi:RNA polymerase-binding transcription factor DksA
MSLESDDASVLLADARARARRRIDELQATFDAIVESSDTANLDDEHDPEGATVGFERAQLLALLERAHTQLAELDAAVERLHLGHYGTCEVCGRAIPDARLLAQPAARACVACASR